MGDGHWAGAWAVGRVKKEISGDQDARAHADAGIIGVVDGVLIVPMYDDNQEIGWRGVAPETGKTLWEGKRMGSRTATPAWTTIEGKPCLLSFAEEVAPRGSLNVPGKGVMRCVDPKTGNVLWEHKGIANENHFAHAPGEGYIFLNIGSKEIFSKGRAGDGTGDVVWMRFACYKLSAKGAEKLWEMKDEQESWHEPSYEASCWRKYLIRNSKIH